MPQSKLTSKGQTTIPLQVRESLGLRKGDAIEFVIKGDGSVILQCATRDVHALRGFLHRSRMTPVSVEDMDAAVRKAAVTRYLGAASKSARERRSGTSRTSRRRP